MEDLVAQFLNSDIKSDGGNAEPLNIRLGKRGDAAATAVNTTNTAMAYEKGTFSFVSALRAAQFTANGTFTVPAGVNVIYVTAISAGGDGGSGSGAYAGGGGACGNFVIRLPLFVTPGQQLTITVGNGNTVIGSFLTLLKGANGANATSSAAGAGGKNQTASNDNGAGGLGGQRPGGGGVTFGQPGTRGACMDGISIPGSPGGAAGALTGSSGAGGGVPLVFVSPGTTGAGANSAAWDSGVGNNGGPYGAGASGAPGSSTANQPYGGTGGLGYVLIEW